MNVEDLTTKELVEELKRRKYVEAFVATEDVKVRDNRKGRNELFGDYTILVVRNDKIK